MENYYDILGIEFNSSKQEIKKQYRKLVKKYHPDENLDNHLDQDLIKKINTAYEVLINDEKRREYDQKLNFENFKSKNYSEEENYEKNFTFYNKNFKLLILIKNLFISFLKISLYILAYPIVKLILLPISLIFKGFVFLLLNVFRLALVIFFLIDISFLGIGVYGTISQKTLDGILVIIIFLILGGILIWITIFSEFISEKLEDISSDFILFCIDF